MNGPLGAGAMLNWHELATLLWRLALDLAVATVVIRTIHYRLYRRREYLFTYFAFNVVTCCLCLLLSGAPVSFGLALFGVFGILRYRTEQIGIRDLTYLFIVIGLGVLNGVAYRSLSVAELLVINGVIVTMTALLELGAVGSRERATRLVYDQIELLRPGNEDRLIADLAAKTGLVVVRVEIERFDLLRDAAEITAFSRDAR